MEIKHKALIFGICVLTIISINVMMLNIEMNNFSNNQNFSQFEPNDFEVVNLNTHDLSSDSSFTGIGAPWNVTHYANYTKSNLAVSFNNNSYDDTNAQVELYGWNGYQLNSTITNLYDTRNWSNGTFHAGSFVGGSPSGTNDSDYIDDWTFKNKDLTGIGYYVNPMRGNYYDTSTSISDYQDCLELAIDGDSNGRYDVGDKCWWETPIELDRGDVEEAWLSFSVRAKSADNYNNHMVLQVVVNNKIIWGMGLASILEVSGNPDIGYYGEWYEMPPIYLDGNDAQIFPEGLKNMNVTLEFKRVSGEDTPGYGDHSLLFDNVSLIVKARAKPSHLELQLNGEDINDAPDYGEGNLGIVGNWNGTIQSSVIANFSSNLNWPFTFEKDGTWISYSIELDANLNLFTTKSTPETYYTADPDLVYQGSSFSSSNNSDTIWTTYARMEIPVGFEETNMTIEFPSDYNLTGVFFSLNPNSISQTSITEYGNKKVISIPVSSITSNTNGFWKLIADAPNYCEQINIYNNNTGVWESSNEFLSGEFINITGKINNSLLVSGYIQQTKAQLQIRFPNGTIWTTQNQLKAVENSGWVYFDPIKIPDNVPNYEVGEYEAIITWNNTYSSYGFNETGVIYKKFTVVHESLLYPDEGVYFIENIIDDRNINIKVSYRDLINGKAIEDAYVYTDFSGVNEALIQTSPGFYLFEFNASNAIAGNNSVSIYANSSYYLNENIDVTVEVIKQSILTVETDFFNVPWKQNFTVRFNYTEKNNPLNGIDTTAITIDEWLGDYHLTQPSIGQYELECNTSAYNTLTLHSFIILLESDNYESQSVLIRVQLTELASSIDNVMLNGTLTTSLQIAWNELFDISIFYNDTSTGTFISGANVQISGASYSKMLVESGNEYIGSINTSVFSIGNNFLTILAQKENFNIASRIITIIVLERDTDLNIILDGIPTTSISLAYNELLNITAIYKDTTGYFLDDATLELRLGGTLLYSFSPNPTYNQYNLTLNTNELTLGVNSLSIYAKKDNYTANVKSITITVTERATIQQIYLNNSLTTSIEYPYLETLNITSMYFDTVLSSFIGGATLELRDGETVIAIFSPHGSYAQYELLLDTSVLNIGVNVLGVHAKQDNYSASLVSITITVTERYTSMDVYLNESSLTSIEYPYAEILNITVSYRDTLLDAFISEANVELREGSTTLYTFSQHGVYDQYYLELNTADFNVGVHAFNIYAKKDNYSISLENIVVTIAERDTNLDTLINGENAILFIYYNSSIGEFLNITSIYRDHTGYFLDNSVVELTGEGISEILIKDIGYDQYSTSLMASNLGVGVHFLTITAKKDNYSISIQNIKINVKERQTNMQLYLDEVNATDTRYISVEIGDLINITVYLTDFLNGSDVTGATINLIGPVNGVLTFNPSYNHYNITISADDLGQGINFLTVFAQKQNYESQSILFTIEVTELLTNLHLFLNEANKTLDKSIQVTVGDIVNISLIYEDHTGTFIDGALVQLVGEGLSNNLTEHSIYDLYNFSLDSRDLNFGVNFLTLYAQKFNYQPQTIIIKIEIIDKETDLNLYLNSLNKTLDPTFELPIGDTLNITVKYFDFETGDHISGALIQLIGEGLTENMTEFLVYEQYSILINTNQIDIGVRFLSIFAQKANYQSFTMQLRIQVNRIQTNITTTSGEDVIYTRPGEPYTLSIRLFDTDFGQPIINANVTFTGFGAGGTLEHVGDGVYEYVLVNLPEGETQITITAYAGDDYDFERFIISIYVVRPPEETWLFMVLTIVGIAAAACLGAYLFAYQKVLKYPKQVRKIHKYKKSLDKKNAPKVDIQTRDDSLSEVYSEELEPISKGIKGKLK